MSKDESLSDIVRVRPPTSPLKGTFYLKYEQNKLHFNYNTTTDYHSLSREIKDLRVEPGNREGETILKITLGNGDHKEKYIIFTRDKAQITIAKNYVGMDK